jgi:xanthine dehydrogenase accessory factor
MITNPTDTRVLIRGVVRSGIQIDAGVKVGNVDPGFETEYCDTISGKARAIGGGVVEAIFHSFQGLKNPAT